MMKRWMRLTLLFVLVLSGCSKSETTIAKNVVNGYMKEIQEGHFSEAETYCSKRFNETSSLSKYQETIDMVASESNYSEKEREAFENYVSHVVSSQYATYSFEDVQQSQEECIVILKVEGVSSETLSTIDVQALEKDLKEEFFNTQSEEYIVAYFDSLTQQVSNLPKTDIRTYFVLEKEEGQWKIVSMVSES